MHKTFPFLFQIFKISGFVIIFVWHIERNKRTRSGEKDKEGEREGASKHKRNL